MTPDRRRCSRIGGAAVAFVIATAVAVVVSRAIAGGPPIRRAGWMLLGQVAIWSAAWIVAVIAVWQLPRRIAVALIVGAAVLLRVGAIAGEPITSDDLYRYSWDGRVQAAGVDPYRFPPAAPQLAGLREDWLWPTSDRCVAIRRQPGCTLINRSTVPTIYPPAAEAWFGVIYRVTGIESRHKAWQVAGLAVDLATVGLLFVALRRWRRDVRWTALYALCPAAVLELANNGHVDGVAVALMLAALVVARPPPRPSTLLRSAVVRDVVVGLLIGAAVLVKLYPALLLVALAAAPGTDRWRRAARSSASAAALVVLAYVPHVLAAGGRVLGYLPGYLAEEDYATGGRFLLVAATGLDGALAAVVSLAVFVGVVTGVVLRRPGVPIGAVVLFGTLLLLTSPVQPWYSITVLALAALAGRPWWAAVTLAGYPYFFAVILDSPHAVAIGQVAYGCAAIAVVAGELATAHATRRRADVVRGHVRTDPEHLSKRAPSRGAVSPTAD